MTEVIIMIGKPGSGKSSWAARNLEPGSYVIVEADKFFEKDGVYTFDQTKLDQAHEFCFKEYYWYVSRCGYPACDYPEIKHIIVANTNTMMHEFTPYVALAKLFKLSVRFVKLDCSVETSMKRNIHNVPERTLKNMQDRLARLTLPFGHKFEVINTD